MYKFLLLMLNLISNFRYPDYGSDIDIKKTKYDNDETYIAFNKEFKTDKVPFKKIDIWNRLFPLK